MKYSTVQLSQNIFRGEAGDLGEAGQHGEVGDSVPEGLFHTKGDKGQPGLSGLKGNNRI